MIENKETYIFNEEENAVVRSFTVLKNGKLIAGGFVAISNEELLLVYANDPELALRDPRTTELLNKEQK